MEDNIYRELVEGLLSILQERIVRIVLYGSTARGTNVDDSDVDIAVFVSSCISHQQEDELSEFIVDMDLKYDKVFSVIDIDNDKYLKWRKAVPFYQNVDNEGVVLWKAA